MADKNNPTAEERLAMALEVIEKQGERLAALESKLGTDAPEIKQEKLAPPTETFMVDKTKYQFTVARYIDSMSRLVNAKDALNNPAELERLHIIKSGIIKQVK